MFNRLVKKSLARRPQRAIKEFSQKIWRYKNLRGLQNIFKSPRKIKRRVRFKSSIAPEVWKKMSQEARNAHKARQAAHKARVWSAQRRKEKVRLNLILNKYPRGYDSIYRKTRTLKIPGHILRRKTTRIVKRFLETIIRQTSGVRSAYQLFAWEQTLNTAAFKIGKYSKLNAKIRKAIRIKIIACLRAGTRLKGACNTEKFYHRLFGIFRPAGGGRPIRPRTQAIYRYSRKVVNRNNLVCWNVHLPPYYLFPMEGPNSIFDGGEFIYVSNEFGSTQIDKNVYGSLLLLYNDAILLSIKGNVSQYEVFKTNFIPVSNVLNTLRENAVIGLYSSLTKSRPSMPITAQPTSLHAVQTSANSDKRGYIKHVVRLRYRWYFQPKLSKFKLFKKFFKRSLKRYRRIGKNRLFINKFRSHFQKLTGFTEKGLLQLWLPFRRNYNQYWSTTNAVLRFSQSLILTPVSFLVFLQLSPSFAASKHIIKSGAVSINGLAVTAFTQLRPGDIMQLNFVIWNSVRQYFDYQRWNNDFRSLQHVSFLQIDWSSLMFMMVRWPRKYELVAPSFLSERWIRYYIRQFPSKIRNFRKADGNWKIYKRLIVKR